MDCAELAKYVREKFKRPLYVIKEEIRESRMTDAEILSWRIPNLPSGGSSWQPGKSFLYRNEHQTLADLFKKQDIRMLKQTLDNYWYVFLPEKKITVYRASIYPIIPGSYVTDMLQYAMDHKERMGATKYLIFSMDAPKSSLIWMGDPHEFIYAPTLEEWKAEARDRVKDIPVELQNEILKCNADDSLRCR